MKITMIVVCFGLLLSRYVWCGSVHFLVTDQDGHPVPGAFVKLKWWDLPDGSQYPVPHVKCFQATENGRIVAPVDEDEDRCVEAAGKKGYRYEDYLNPNRTEYAKPQVHSEANPFRIVLRKLLDEKACLLDCRYVPPRDHHSFPINVDIFRKFCNDRSCGERYGYTDFTVKPYYDRATKNWTLTIVTTNANCGLIATTNRVYRAPETGYAQRVDVTQDVYTHRAFTLYCRTREPQIYGMITFKPYDIRSSNRTYPTFDFQYDTAFFNPTGSRTLENDDTLKTLKIDESIRTSAFESLVFDHRYPPRPDIRARVENRKRRAIVEKELKQLQDRANECYRLEIKPLRDKNKGLSTDELDKILEPARRKVWKIRDQMRPLRDKLEELDKEILTLVLPESQPANVVQPKNER